MIASPAGGREDGGHGRTARGEREHAGPDRLRHAPRAQRGPPGRPGLALWSLISSSGASRGLLGRGCFGSGGFGVQQTITTLTNGPKSVYAADMDGDADMDVLAFRHQLNRHIEKVLQRCHLGRHAIWCRRFMAVRANGEPAAYTRGRAQILQVLDQITDIVIEGDAVHDKGVGTENVLLYQVCHTLFKLRHTEALHLERHDEPVHLDGFPQLLDLPHPLWPDSFHFAQAR